MLGYSFSYQENFWDVKLGIRKCVIIDLFRTGMISEQNRREALASRLCIGAIQGGCETWNPCQYHVIDFSSMKRSPAISANQSLISHLSTKSGGSPLFLHIFSLILQFASFPREQTRCLPIRLSASLSRLSATDLVSAITADWRSVPCKGAISIWSLASVPHVPYWGEIWYSEGVESCGVEYIFREFKHWDEIMAWQAAIWSSWSGSTLFRSLFFRPV